MTKRRYLRKSIAYTLATITTIMFVLLAMVDDFDLSVAPIYIGLWLITYTNIYILYKYANPKHFEERN